MCCEGWGGRRICAKEKTIWLITSSFPVEKQSCCDSQISLSLQIIFAFTMVGPIIFRNFCSPLRFNGHSHGWLACKNCGQPRPEDVNV